MMTIDQMIRTRGIQKQWIAKEIGIDRTVFSRVLSGYVVLPNDKLRPLARALRYPLAEVQAAVAELPVNLPKKDKQTCATI